MRLPCPFCGDRVHAEFSYLGDAGAVRPRATGSGAPDPALFQDYVYLRDNPAGRHREWWQHAGGCRSWLVITRDTVTHAVLGVEPAGDGEGR